MLCVSLGQVMTKVPPSQDLLRAYGWPGRALQYMKTTLRSLEPRARLITLDSKSGLRFGQPVLNGAFLVEVIVDDYGQPDNG